MRFDGSNMNGAGQMSNGSAGLLPRKPTLSQPQNNQLASLNSNGDNLPSRLTGTTTGAALASPYFGHDREEVTRILIQSLYDLGYNRAAESLSAESGYQLETEAVAAFRNAVLNGRWPEAEDILFQSFNSEQQSEGEHSSREKLVLAEGANKNQMLFYLRQQKFLELLESRDLSAALTVLRTELTPLNYDINQLHALSSLLMCPAEHLHDHASWDGPVSSSRERLLSELSGFISPSVMIPDHRLAILLDHVKRSQINQCLYHNTCLSPSLYADHACSRNDFPLQVGLQLNHHSDEVWYCEFSHDGTKLVTAGRDHAVIIYDTSTFSVLHRLVDHEEGVAHASWSPDDSKLVTCSQDRRARVWDAETGCCILTINHHRQPVTAAAWAADGESFVTASLDVTSPLCHWNLRGQAIRMWAGGFRIQDCAITSDGRRLVAADVEEKIHVYNLLTHEEEYCLPLKSKPTSVAVSRDSRHMLISLSEGQIQLIDIDTMEVVRRFHGQKQGSFVIRSSFGGAGENFVVSGSEDSLVYVWHKENGILVETLDAHISGCVNAISWSPTTPGTFASAGDDRSVKIWIREHDTPCVTADEKHRPMTSDDFTRTSALRSTSSL